ncbi:MAG: hypothetical protein KKB70_07810 [Proteobacteria bacterium]|nr:hypothetical protein [Pseudomonadota bacterium]
MRIRERGQASGDSDTSLMHGKEERARLFKSRHHVGQNIRGIFLRSDPSGLAWISFDGLALLTGLESPPPPGTRLHFIIQALHPDILLRETRDDGGGSGQTTANHVQAFDALRTSFETGARDILLAQAAPAPPLIERRDRLFEALSAQDQKRFLATAEALANINGRLSATGTTRLYYLPWLLPALRMDLILRKERKNDLDYLEISLGYETQGAGAVQMRILARPGRAGVRAYLERHEHLPAAESVLRALGPHLDENIIVLGAVPQKKYAHGGILSELLVKSPHSFLGLGS